MVPTAHKRFSDSVISRLEGDARILGLGAGGSWIQGDMDEFSDLDFVVITDPGRHSSVLRDAKAIAHSLGPCLS
ncbi:MAG TPA: oxalate:formate antiporter, partial [Bdellovibrionota bacterium]